MNNLLNLIDRCSQRYFRLILFVAPAGSGKTQALRHLCQITHFPLINVNLEVSYRILDLPKRERQLKLPQVMAEIIGEYHCDKVILDNLEILFDTQLQQDPLRLLQNLSRNTTILASWNGSVESGWLTYAEPMHTEYKKYALDGLIIIHPNDLLNLQN